YNLNTHPLEFSSILSVFHRSFHKERAEGTAERGFSSMIYLVIASFCLLGTTSAQQFAYAVDINQAGTPSSFDCLRQWARTIFVRAYKPDESGGIDFTALPNIKNAFNAGIGIEIFITPNPVSSKSAITQVDEAVNSLINGGVSIKSLWIMVTSPINWGKNQAANFNFVNYAVQRIRARGIRPGVYTSIYDWAQITNWARLPGNDVMLWYWNVYAPGGGGESPPNFSDFRPFGNWNSANVKQFGQAENVCGFTLNRDVYPASSVAQKNITRSMIETNRIDVEENDIVVGTIGV
ncbi:hypothetical protein PENTCL1PPCAC_16863, partial [Pristionchus entomophagus]